MRLETLCSSLPSRLPRLTMALGSSRSRAWFLLGVMATAGCASPAERAAESGFDRTTYPTQRFVLTAWHRGLGSPTAILHVYIEGDGRAFKRGQVSSDPTPRMAIGLELARQDPHGAVLYLGRPCQYLDRESLSACHPRYWSTHRFAPEVIESMNTALDQAIAAWRSPPRLVLIGYSGGGSVAALLGSTRTDVAALVTVASNLAVGAWTTHHEVPRLSGSLDPAQVLGPDFISLKQRHLAGGKDAVVPPEIVRRFLREVGLPGDLLEVVPNFSHHCCWARIWPRPLCGLSPAVLC